MASFGAGLCVCVQISHPHSPSLPQNLHCTEASGKCSNNAT
jgi:hypothetical protein